MTVFEHSFTLIGLVLGLALVEVLGNLVRAVRHRKTNPLGLLTPLLAVFLIADIASFWGVLWELRTVLPSVIWQVLGFGILLCSIYYAAASLVFPDSRDAWGDLDAYYMKQRRVVLGLIFLCSVIVMALQFALGRPFAPLWVAIWLAYLVLLAFTALAPGRRANVAGLAALISLDAYALFS